MKTLFLCASAIALLVAVDTVAQGPSTSSPDPRVGLKPGVRTAGVAMRNMELVASLPKPRGFFDPGSPGGLPTPPEPDPGLPPQTLLCSRLAKQSRVLSALPIPTWHSAGTMP